MTAFATLVALPAASSGAAAQQSPTSKPVPLDQPTPPTSVASTQAPLEATGPIVDSPGCTAASLSANDDESSGPEPLPFALDFFGPNRSTVYVNNNGNVTFDGPLVDYTPSAISGAAMKIIAPFWADVDTTGPSSAVVQYGSTTFEGHLAFCVNWVGVGFYAGRDDKLNSFQLLLVQREDTGSNRNFDMVFNYGQIQWETGDASGGTDGLGGSAARVGYSNGASRSFELSGSSTPGAFLDSSPDGLAHRTVSATVNGRIVVPVRGGVPTPPDQPDPGGTPSPPENVFARTMGQGKVRVGWTAPDDGGDPITSYDVYRDGVLVGTVPAEGETTLVGSESASPTSHTYIDRTAPAGPPVNYEVVAINSSGASRASAAASTIPAFAGRPAYSRNPWRDPRTPNAQALTQVSWVPALQDHFTPQGLTLLPAGTGGLWPTRTILISGYVANTINSNTGRCYVHAINPATGGSRGWYRFPSSPCQHAGGIEYTSGNRVWVADTHTLFLLNVGDMFRPRNAIFAIKQQTVLNGLNGSFVFDQPTGGECSPGPCLWIGHWREGQKTLLHRYNENSLMGRRTISPTRHPLRVPRDAQGAAWKDGVILVSASTSQCGLLHGVSTTTGATFWTRQFSPGTEEIAVDGASGIWNVSEAGAWRFARKPAFFPVVARWNIADLRGAGAC